MREAIQYAAEEAKRSNRPLPQIPAEVKHIGKCEGVCNKNIVLHIFEDGSTKETGCQCELVKRMKHDLEENKHMQFINNSDIPYSSFQAVFEKYETDRPEQERAKRIAMNYAEKFTKNHMAKQLFKRVSRYAFRNKLTIEQANEKLGTAADESSENIKTNLILMGTPGTGKTMLASAIFYTVANQDFKCFFVESTRYIEMLKEGFKDPEKTRVLTRFIEEADLLIVDDIGTSFNNAWAVEQFKMLTDKRKGKFTIYTTNLKESEFMGSTELHRIFSRMNQNSHLQKMNFEDKRL